MIRRLLKDRSGAAAAEMALMTPLLMILMFGSFELGNYFWNGHIVTKAVRDGARYASRQSFDNFDCSAETVSSAVITDTQNLTRTSQIASGGSARLAGWTDANSVNVEMRPGPVEDYAGFYTGMDCVPVVIVTATVPYTSLFATLGFDTTGLNVSANSEVPVMGI
jgi:Flp pilus assembly protein TadG